MTVHGSKGLQAPVVILPDTVRIKNLGRDAKWLKDGDILLYPLNKDAYTNRCCELVEKEKALSLEEYHRLLYVALTRAEDHLCVCGYKKKSKPNEESWYEIFKEAFANLNINQKDGVSEYCVEQLLAVEKVDNIKTPKTEYKLPIWLREIPADEGFLAKPLTPSHQDESLICAVSPLVENNDGKLFARGKLIHKMLQFLPMSLEEKRDELIDVFLSKQADDFNDVEKMIIKLEVKSLLENSEFAPLFSAKSVAEVSLIGVSGEHIISGQIDRLVVCDDKVMIVDYKTNRPAAKTVDDVPEAYIKQMKSYKDLVKQIYKDKKVEAYILWTNTAKIMKLDNV